MKYGDVKIGDTVKIISCKQGSKYYDNPEKVIGRLFKVITWFGVKKLSSVDNNFEELSISYYNFEKVEDNKSKEVFKLEKGMKVKNKGGEINIFSKLTNGEYWYQNNTLNFENEIDWEATRKLNENYGLKADSIFLDETDYPKENKQFPNEKETELKEESQSKFEVGDYVRILSGFFEGLEGTIGSIVDRMALVENNSSIITISIDVLEKIKPNDSWIDVLDSKGELVKKIAINETPIISCRTFTPDSIILKNPANVISIPSLDKHYDFTYELTDKDKERGKIKVDPYFVAKQWELNNGNLFHIFKTLCRWGRKNPIERETKATLATLFRYAELENIDLKEMCEDYIQRNK